MATQVCRDIVARRVSPGSLLPTATEMCERFSVSRTTLGRRTDSFDRQGPHRGAAKGGNSRRPKTDWSLLDPEVLASVFEAYSSNGHFVRSCLPCDK